jgi:oligopeptidase B
LSDPYAWLKAENWRDVLEDADALPDDIRGSLEAENTYTRKALRGTGPLRATLTAEMRARIREDESEVPTPDGPFAYFERFRQDGEHPLVCRQPREGGPAVVLLDADREAIGADFFDLGDWAHSPDHRLLAWSTDRTGAEHYTIRVRHLATGKDLADRVPHSAGDVIWLGDASGFYYVEVDESRRPVRIRRHRLGTSASDDEVIFEERDSGFFLDLDLTQSGAYVLVCASDHETSEVWLLDRNDPSATVRLVEPRRPGVQYEVEHHGEELIILTNVDDAEDFKLVAAPVANPAREGWRDLVPHRPGTLIVCHVALSRHLVRVERKNGNPRILVREIGSGSEHEIAFPDEGYSLAFCPGYEFDTQVIRYSYSSLTSPAEVVDLDLGTGERSVRKRQELPSGYDPSLYVARRIFARSHDGEEVPVSILHRQEVNLDGSAPCYLYAYGAYGAATGAAFRTNPLSLVDRGFVYAIAHVRGGTEKGWRWYRDGKGEKKPNSFSDFVSCAEALVAARYTSRGRIVAYGCSAGGMIMGAVANLAPDLFAGIIADVPFVDVLNTMLDGDLPLTPPEWPEWGNPRADKKAFASILSYSPYENVREQAYPPILALAGLPTPA